MCESKKRLIKDAEATECLHYFDGRQYSKRNITTIWAIRVLQPTLYSECIFQNYQRKISSSKFIISSFHDLMQSRGVRRPSVCPSVNFAQIVSSRRQIAGSPPNLHTMVPRRACIQRVLKVKVEVKRHSSHGETVCQTVCYTVRSHVLRLHALTL